MRIVLYGLLLGVLLSACGSEQNKEIKLKYTNGVYTIVRSGDGEQPKPGDFSIFSIIIKGDDGTVLLDRSKEHNYGKFQIPQDSSQFRKGSPVDELITLLVEGDSAVLTYTLDSLEKLNPMVKNMNTIIYEINIKEVTTQAEMVERTKQENIALEEKSVVSREKGEIVAKRLAEVLEAYKNKSLGDGLKATSSGMEYFIEKQGDGAKPNVGDACNVHYYGVLESNGNMFDNSYSRGKEFSFSVGVGQVIKGWDEALLLMNKGTEAIFFIPYQLAYGAAGRPPQIPEKSMLVFYIEYH